MDRYRYISFFLCTFLIFHDNGARAIPPLAMIGGMVKKNCSDPLDTGEYCWSDQLKANFLAVFYYGYTFQMVSTYLAKRVGFNSCVRLATFICAAAQLTVPVAVAFSPILAIVIQGLRGFVCGVFMSNNFECARKWSLKDEGKMVISLTGIMSFTGSGIGPFIVGILTETFGWRYAFYVNGTVFFVAFLLLTIFVPDDPLDAKYMSAKEHKMFVEKKMIEGNGSETTSELMSSLRPMFQLKYLYCFCVYGICRNILFFTVVTMMPFYFNEMFDTHTEFLAYLLLGLSFVIGLSVSGFSKLLNYVDQRISWLKSRVFLMVVPMILRGVCLAIIPFTRNLIISIVLLVFHHILTGSVYSGGIMTVTFELDPANSAVMIGFLNGLAQASGFITPLVSTAITSVEEGRADYWEVREERWRNFFLFNGAMSALAVLSVVVSLVWGRKEWVKHPSLCVIQDEKIKDCENAVKVPLVETHLNVNDKCSSTS